MFLLNVVVNKYIRDVKPHIYSHFGNYPGGGGHLSWGASVLGGRLSEGAFVPGGICPGGGQVSGGASVLQPFFSGKNVLCPKVG